MKPAVLLSAGLGTRLKPYTHVLAKPAIDFLTIPMAAFTYFYLNRAHVDSYFINTHHLPDTIKSVYKGLIQNRAPVEFSYENPILGSGGALLAFKNKIKNHFYLCNADNVFLFSDVQILDKMYAEHKSHGSLATILLTPHPEAGKTISACWVNAKNEVKGFGLKPPHEGLMPLHFCGIQVLNPKILNLLPEGESNILYDILVPSIARGERVNAFICESLFWHETGNLNDYLDATQILLKALQSNTSWGKSFTQLQQELFFKSKLLVGSEILQTGLEAQDQSVLFCSEDFKVKPGTKISVSGFNVIGQNVELSGRGNLKNVVIHSNAHVQLQSDFSNTLILNS